MAAAKAAAAAAQAARARGGSAHSALGPQASPEEVQGFILLNPVDPEASTRLRAMPPHLQRIVMDRGPLMGTRNPSSVLIVRIRDAERGANRTAEGLGMAAPPPPLGSDPIVERLIRTYNLDARAAGMLRALPPDQQQAAALLPLSEARNPSAFVMAQLSMPRNSSGVTGFLGGMTSGGGSPMAPAP
ncbi:unnamed protein product, partial [Polarella glacialis]